MIPSIRCFFLLLVLIVVTGAELGAQNVVVTGAISGRITDPSGAVVPGASLVVSNTQTGVRQSTAANLSGIYRVVVPPGTNSITVNHKGFRSVQVDQIPVLIGNTTMQDIRLQLGASDDAITVIATNPLLRPTESSITTVIERGFLEDIPLSGRRYADFTLLSPNSSADGPLGWAVKTAA